MHRIRCRLVVGGRDVLFLCGSHSCASETSPHNSENRIWCEVSANSSSLSVNSPNSFVPQELSLFTRKTLLGLSGADKQRLGTGKLINLIGGDATKVERMFWFFHLTWAGPLQVLFEYSTQKLVTLKDQFRSSLHCLCCIGQLGYLDLLVLRW